MKKPLLFGLIVALAIGLYVYRDDLYERLQPSRCADGEVWDPQEGACIASEAEDTEPDEDAQVVSEFSMSDVDTIVLSLSDAAGGSVSVMRDHGSTRPFETQFATAHTPVDGIVSILAEHATYDAATENIFVPYAVNYGGSGTFVHAGLFTRQNSTLMLRDTYLIGDRVLIEQVRFSGGALHILFRDRQENEPFSATPTVAKEAVVPVSGTAFGDASVQLREDAS